jgi:hypothetical protein
LAINHRRPPGLAVGSVFSNADPIHVNILETRRGRAAMPSFSSSAEEPAGESLEETPPVELDLESFRPHSYNEPRPGRTTLQVVSERALQTSWAVLGYMTANDEAYELWSPESLRVRLGYDSGSRREAQRVERSIEGGAAAVGVTYLVPMPGGALEVFLGVDTAVDTALRTVDAARILSAQSEAALLSSSAIADVRGTAETYAASPNGARLLLRPV